MEALPDHFGGAFGAEAGVVLATTVRVDGSVVRARLDLTVTELFPIQRLVVDTRNESDVAGEAFGVVDVLCVGEGRTGLG